MKGTKIISFVLSVLLVCGMFGFAASAEDSALPLSAGLEALQGQFEKGVGPRAAGYQLDYRYYSPVKTGDSTKYPLVIWLHGMSEGAYEGKQVIQNNIAYWTSAEFQSRFTGAGGAFILAPRSVEEELIFWDDSMIIPLRAAIDDFIAQNRENIDLSRIYIGGFSMGGKMTLKMAIAYPDMFAAAFPICPAWPDPAKELLSCLRDMPIWLTSGTADPLVNYYASVTPIWNQLMAMSSLPEQCRFSTLSKVCYPDGTPTSSSHHAWFAVNYDMFSADNGDYPYMTTVDGNGNPVTLTYPNGMISWLSQFTSDYDGASGKGSGNIPITDETHDLFSGDTIVDVLNALVEIFRVFIEALQSIFRF